MSEYNPFTGSWHLWPEAAIRVALQQAEIQLGHIAETQRAIMVRAYNLFGISISLLIAISIFLIRELDTGHPITISMKITIVAALCAGVCVALLLRIILPMDMYNRGSLPGDVLFHELLTTYEDMPEILTRVVLLQECESYDKKILFNLEQTKAKQRQITWAISSYLVTVAILLLALITFLF